MPAQTKANGLWQKFQKHSALITQQMAVVRRARLTESKAAFLIGRELFTVHKKLCKRGCEGKFKDYIDTQLKGVLTRRTADRYRKLYENFKEQNLDTVSRFGVTAMMDWTKYPAKVQKRAMELAKKGSRITNTRLRSLEMDYTLDDPHEWEIVEDLELAPSRQLSQKERDVQTLTKMLNLWSTMMHLVGKWNEGDWDGEMQANFIKYILTKQVRDISDLREFVNSVENFKDMLQGEWVKRKAHKRLSSAIATAENNRKDNDDYTLPIGMLI